MVAAVMKNQLTIWAGLAAVFTLSSCLQNEITVTVKADGSGTVVEETMLGAQMAAMMGGLGALGGLGGPGPDGEAGALNPLDQMFSEETAKKKAATMGEGVTLDKVEKIDKDGKKGGRVTYAFKDINQLKLRMDGGADALGDAGAGMPGAEDAGAAKPESEPVRFKFAGGKLTILTPQGREAPEVPEEAEKIAGQPEMQAMAKEMFADMKMAIRVVIEPGIKKTDATHVEGDKITLMEMDFGELMKNPDGMAVLDKMERMKTEDVAAMLKDVKGVKVETKETVSVEFK